MDAIRPETTDTGTSETPALDELEALIEGSNEDEEDAEEEEQPIEEAPAEVEAEKPSKKWAGQFDSPEEMEREFHRLGQEKNEARKLVEAYEKALETVKPKQEQVQDEVSFEDKLYSAELQRAEKKFAAQKNYLEDHEFEKLVTAEAIERTETKLEIHRMKNEFEGRLQGFSNQQAWNNDPRKPMVDFIASQDPEIAQALNQPGGFQVALKLAEMVMRQGQAQQMNASPPASIPKPAPNKAAGGNVRGTSGTGEKFSSTEQKMFEKLGISTEQGKAAYYNTVYGGKR